MKKEGLQYISFKETTHRDYFLTYQKIDYLTNVKKPTIMEFYNLNNI